MKTNTQIVGSDGHEVPQSPAATSESNTSTPPVMGGRRSLREIPRTEKPKDTVPLPMGSRLDDALLEALRRQPALLHRAWLLDYVEVPPSIGEFIWDERFFGQTYRREEGADELYPVWEETLDRDFDLDSETHNVVLTGALGIGKTTVLVLIREDHGGPIPIGRNRSDA